MKFASFLDYLSVNSCNIFHSPNTLMVCKFHRARTLKWPEPKYQNLLIIWWWTGGLLTCDFFCWITGISLYHVVDYCSVYHYNSVYHHNSVYHYNSVYRYFSRTKYFQLFLFYSLSIQQCNTKKPPPGSQVCFITAHPPTSPYCSYHLLYYYWLAVCNIFVRLVAVNDRATDTKMCDRSWTAHMLEFHFVPTITSYLLFFAGASQWICFSWRDHCHTDVELFFKILIICVTFQRGHRSNCFVLETFLILSSCYNFGLRVRLFK